MSTKSAKDYCDNCNAPHNNSLPRIVRCGTCRVINGKLPPTKYAPIKAAITQGGGE